MECPNCGHDFGDGMIPARCPSCGQNLRASDASEGSRLSAETRSRVQGYAESYADYSDTHRSPVFPVIAIVVLAALIGVGAFFAWKLELWGGSSLPDMVGWNVDRATDTLVDSGYIVSVTSEKADGAENLIIRQEPAAGTRLDAGGEVSLVISEARIVPDVVGKPLEEAQALMDAEGLHFTIVEDLSDEPENTVLSCNYAAGRKADSTDSIQLMVSKPRIVPELIGKTEEEATDLIEALGCTAKITYVKGSEGQAEGTVVSVMPQVGERVTGGSTIEISVVKKRTKELEELARACLGAIYNCDPHADRNAIGAGLRPYLAPSAPSSDYDVWISMVKRNQSLPAEVDPVLGELPRHLDSIDAITVDTDGTVHCTITVTWDWTVMGEGYEGVHSTDTRDVTLRFDEENRLIAVYDANTDVPYYEMVW